MRTYEPSVVRLRRESKLSGSCWALTISSMMLVFVAIMKLHTGRLAGS